MSLDKFKKPATPDKNKMTPNQRAMIWAELKKLDPMLAADKELVRDMAREFCGKTISQFSRTDATKFIKHIKMLQGKDPNEGFVQYRRRKPAPVRSTGGSGTDTISEAQLDYIADLYTKLGAEPHHRRAFNERQCGKPWPQTKNDAKKIITALKTWSTNGQRFGHPRRSK